MREVHRLVALAQLIAAATSCTAFKEDPELDAARDERFDSAWALPDGATEVDGAGDDRSPGPTGSLCNLSKPFGPRQLVTGLTSGTWIGGRLWLSPDELTGYFPAVGLSDASLNTHSTIFTATRDASGSPFGMIMPLQGFNMSEAEGDPTLSGNGLTLLFTRTPADMRLSHIYGANRPSLRASFDSVTMIESVNSADAADLSPSLREDGQVLYFASSRVIPNGYDIYRSEWNGTGFGSPVAMSEINTRFGEFAPVVSADDLVIYFSSDRPDGNGSNDIWMARRATVTDLFSCPTNVTELNSLNSDVPSFVTRDGCKLYFVSGTLSSEIFVASKPADP
jgi:hypothetical protein